MAVLEPTDTGYYLWHYLPSIPAAVVFCLLFLAATALLVWHAYPTRAWSFCAAFLIGNLFEAIGYIGRIVAHSNTSKLMPYIIQSFFILLGPILFAATIYMVLGRIITRVHADAYSMIRPGLLTRTFVTGDVLALFIQGGAAGLMVKPSMADIGKAVVIAGLIFQVLMFGLFMAIALVFHRRMRAHPTPSSYELNLPWERTLYLLYAVSALVMLRSVFRVAEFSLGYDGYLLAHEWPLYVFDGVPMIVVSFLFGWFYPSWLATKDFNQTS